MNTVTWGYGRANAIGLVPAFGYGRLLILVGLADLIEFTFTIVQRRVFDLER